MTFISKGGYQKIKENIIRDGGINKHTAVDLSNISQTTVDALNAIQNTPWSVNQFTLSVVIGLQEEQKNVTYKDADTGENETFIRFEKPEKPMLRDLTANEVEGMTESDWKDRNTQKRKKLQRYESQLGVCRSTHRIVDLAKEMSEHDVFYFPHALDFRTRIYPIPTDLTPQGNDLAKGLLRFGRGMKLGAEGFFWLGVMVATRYGFDKLSIADRFRQASEPAFFAMLCRVVADPVNVRDWIQADAPLQFLAAAHEFVSACSLVILPMVKGMRT